MIQVKLMGGLGNQMFQYALARAIADKRNTQVMLDLTTLNHRLPWRGYVFRNFDLDIFDLPYRLTKPSLIPTWPRGLRWLKNPVFVYKKMEEKILCRISPKTYICEKRIHSFDAAVLDAPDNATLVGFWQCYAYIESNAEGVRRDFSSFATELNAASKQMLAQIEAINATANSICINFRRTDYVEVKETAERHGDVGMNYYDKAIAEMASKIANPHFFVFSDDIEWCRNNFKTDAGPVTFVGYECKGPKFSDYLRLMAACNHFIIPNSTFAWWAAWLSKNPNKVVIAPKKWVADPDYDTTDVIPPSWIRL